MWLLHFTRLGGDAQHPSAIDVTVPSGVFARLDSNVNFIVHDIAAETEGPRAY